MAKKKKEVNPELIEETSCCWEILEIPEGATHVEAELDYSACFYESDNPTIKVKFYKKEKNEPKGNKK